MSSNPPPPPGIPPELREPAPRPPDRHEPHTTTKQDMMRAASGYATAFGFIGTVLGFAALGWLIDWWAKTGPWFLVAGVAFGFAGATIKLVRDSRRGR